MIFSFEPGLGMVKMNLHTTYLGQRPEGSKSVFGWGSAPERAGEAYDAAKASPVFQKAHWRRSLGAYWAGRAVRPLCAQWAISVSCPTIFCFQIDFSSISYWTDSYNHARILKPVQSNTFSQKVTSASEGGLRPQTPKPTTRDFAYGPH